MRKPVIDCLFCLLFIACFLPLASISNAAEKREASPAPDAAYSYSDLMEWKTNQHHFRFPRGYVGQHAKTDYKTQSLTTIYPDLTPGFPRFKDVENSHSLLHLPYKNRIVITVYPLTENVIPTVRGGFLNHQKMEEYFIDFKKITDPSIYRIETSEGLETVTTEGFTNYFGRNDRGQYDFTMHCHAVSMDPRSVHAKWCTGTKLIEDEGLGMVISFPMEFFDKWPQMIDDSTDLVLSFKK